MKKLAADDGMCRLLMTAPGVGPVVALNFRAGVDEPACFARLCAVSAHFGLTPARYHSGKLDRSRGISKCGDTGVRWASGEAAGVILRHRTRRWHLRAWGLAVAKRRRPVRAMVAVARRLGTILHRMWVNHTEYHWEAPAA